MDTIETIRFHLSSEVDAVAFLDADQRFETQFIYRQPGFVRRTMLRADDGAWISHTLWRSHSDADAAWKHQHSSEQGVAVSLTWATMVDATSVRRELLTAAG